MIEHLVLVILLTQGPRPTLPAPPVVPIGYIEELFGPVSLRTSKSSKAPIALDSRRDAARRLFAGEQLQCGRGAILRVRRNGLVERIRCPSGWVTLKRVASPQAKASDQVLAEYGRMSGKPVSAPSGIDLFAPSDRGAAIPSDLTIRWTPVADRRTITLVLRDAARREIWQQDRVDARPGSLVSADLREVLIAYRIQHQGALTLTLIDPDGKQKHVTFSLLTEDVEKQLKAELAQWDRESGRIMPRLGRAEAFTRNRLFAEAAAEYDLALRVAPASHDLLIKAIDAHRDAGNLKAASELEARLR